VSNFAEFVNQITLTVSDDIKSYVHYIQETGEIIKISNSSVSVNDLEVLEVNYEKVKDLKLGKRQFSEFYVAFNVALHCITLNEVVSEQKLANIRHQLYEIPISNSSTDIKFINDINNNVLRLSASQSLRIDRVLLHQCAKLSLNFSITANNDPNILHENFSVNLQDLLTNDYLDLTALFRYNTKLKNISIYTTKFFETYSIEEI